jgi:hypothetical protein
MSFRVTGENLHVCKFGWLFLNTKSRRSRLPTSPTTTTTTTFDANQNQAPSLATLSLSQFSDIVDISQYSSV